MARRVKKWQQYQPRNKGERDVVDAVRRRELDRLHWRQTHPAVSEEEKARERVQILLLANATPAAFVEMWRNWLIPPLRRYRRGEPIFLRP